MKAAPGLVVGLGLLVAACGAADAPPAVPTILPTPAQVVPLGERVRATVDILNPDELVFAQDYIWVKTDDGRLVQVDPAGDTVVGEVKVDTTSDPNHYCQGLGTDGTALWACSASGDADNHTIDVVRLDPASRTVVATLPLNKVFDQFDMPIVQGKVWVLAGTGTQLVGVDLGTNQAQPAVDLGARCFQLAHAGENLVAACAFDDLILRLDPASGEVNARVTLDSPRNIAANAQGIWVAQESAVVRLDPLSLEPVAIFSGLPGVGLSGDIFVTDAAVWVRVANGFLYRIDPASNTLVEQIAAGEALSGGSVLAAGDSVWATASDDGRLIRLAAD